MYPPPPREVQREASHLLAVFRTYWPHKPPLKPFIDALRLEGASEEKIKKVRESYARHRRDSDKDQEKIDKIYGKYNTKTMTRKTPKKVLKIFKKK